MSVTDDLKERLHFLVVEAYVRGITVQSNTARQKASEVAAAASMGLVTTELLGACTRTWRPTVKGLAFVQTGSL